MSDTDSFIDEVTEEVRRDKLFGQLKRYGWIGAVAILAIVGGAAWSEYQKSQDRAAAQGIGDEIILALGSNDTAVRAELLKEIEPTTPGNSAVLQFMTAAALSNSDQTEDAVVRLNAIATDSELPAIYRQIATFKALLLQGESMPASERRIQFEALAQPGAPLRLLAQEQLALIDLSVGDSPAAIARLQGILEDAEGSVVLKERASQVIVSLGGTPQTLPGQ